MTIVISGKTPHVQVGHVTYKLSYTIITNKEDLKLIYPFIIEDIKSMKISTVLASYSREYSYRNEHELFNLQCWALTAESFFDDKEWIWLYNHFGYSGDYEFIYME